jgi:hypothetical protein
MDTTVYENPGHEDPAQQDYPGHDRVSP